MVLQVVFRLLVGLRLLSLKYLYFVNGIYSNTVNIVCSVWNYGYENGNGCKYGYNHKLDSDCCLVLSIAIHEHEYYWL